MLDLGTLALHLVVDNRIGSGLAVAKRQADRFAAQSGQAGALAGRNLGQQYGRSAGTHLSRAVGGLGAVLAKVGPMAAVGLGVVGAAGVAMGLKVASGNEQARISFTTMLGSAKKADTFLRQLQKFAAATPFEFPELQTAASSLISAGINANKVIPIMRTLGDVTSGMGTGSEGIKRATVALQQMNAAGKITAEDLNQLRDAGIPVYDLLAQATGKSKAKIAELAAAGKLGKQELTEMMAALSSGKGLERFNGLMEKQSKSLAGMWSTLKDTLGQGLASAIAPAFPLIKQGLESISTGAARLFGWVAKNRGSLTQIFDTAGTSLRVFGRLVGAVVGPFVAGMAGSKASFKSFADFLESHQGAIISALVTTGKSALGIGKAMATGTSMALRAFAFLLDGVTTGTRSVLEMVGTIAQGTLAAFGWIPGLGPKLKAANDAFMAFGRTALDGMRGTAAGARNAADAIDRKVVPAIDKAQKSLDKVGNTEIAKAKLRDSAAKAAQAIREIGTTADGGQIKLKHFSDISDLAADKQKALRGRLSDARQALKDQIVAMQEAGVGQGKLTKAWETGKDRLYAEFRQMGLSRAEARRLAAQYAGIKPKVRTSIEQPGMTDAQRRAKGYKGQLDGIPSKKNTTANLTFKNNAGTIVANLNKTFQLVKGGPKMQLATGGVLPGYTPGRDVHRFYSASPGVPDLDLSGGEAIMRPEFTQRVGGAPAIARMNADAKSGKPIRFASGGVFGSYDAAGDRALGREGTSGSQMYGWGVKKKLEGAMAYAKTVGGPGGPIAGGGYAKALAYARAHVGHPYIFGSLWDCSGFMSSLHSIILGQSPHRRYSTPAFHGAHAAGFTRGKHSPFMVGVRPLAGKLGHMAGTLNGVNVESAGGVGVRVGSRARGWNNGMFSWRGGLANGGVIGDLPFDLLDPEGERYDPRLRRLLEQGYSSGTMSASAGVRQVAEGGGAELVVNPQLRNFRGGERVFNAQETGQLLTDAERGRGGRGAPIIGQFHQHFPASMHPMSAAAAAGSMTVAKLRAVGVG